MSEPTASSARDSARSTWSDRWLLDAFRRAAHPLAEQVDAGARSAWEALERAGVPAAAVLRAACDAASAQPADLALVGPAQAGLLAEVVSRRYGVVPVGRVGNALEIATANPLAEGLEQAIGFAAGCRVRVLVASPAAIASAHARMYVAEAASAAAAPSIAWRRTDGRAGSDATVGRGAASELLDAIVTDALAQGASDAHLEPQSDDMLVRFRIDGVMHDARRVPSETASYMISRLKVQAGLDIADRMRPQDGRASVTYAGRAVDLRISTLPLGNRSEKVVIRMLDSGTASVPLAALGFTRGERERVERLLTMNEGMVLVTGPTGSGKTTTLYSALRHLQNGRTNIVTVEDPIEYRLEGVNQVQVNERAGMTFAAALRSILRQDPDVVLVGEIRDADTASIAIKASMTGHLVLSTLHTNDATSAVARLLDIGADGGSLAGALKGVIAQRLVRKVCEVCSTEEDLSLLARDQQQLLASYDATRVRRAVGCATCRDTGYRGRSVVSEVLVVTPELQRAIARGASVDELTDLARAAGMLSMWESGVERVGLGVTTLNELLDNIAMPIPETDDAGASQQPDIDAIISEWRVGASEAGAGAPASAEATGHETRVRATPATIGQFRPPALSPSPAVGERGRGGAVLVVDEDLLARRAAASALEAAGFEVLQCSDGATALAYVRRLRPAFVVTEVATPRLDATALLRELVGETDAPAVLVFTEQRSAELAGWLAALGARATVQKDGGVDALVAAMRVESRAATALAA